jgi:hypothetical protein
MTYVNLIFCIIIVVLGYWAYTKVKDPLPLYIGMAFGLFGISHLALIFGMQSNENSLVVIRSLAYLLIIYALYRTAKKIKK